MGRPGCLIFFLVALGAALAGALAITIGGSDEPEVASVGTALPQVSSPRVIASSTVSPTATASAVPLPTRVLPTATPQAGASGSSATGSATPGRGDSTGPLGVRACTGNWNASLLRAQEEMAANGYTQADVVFDVALPAPPRFELVGEATIETEQFLSAQIDPDDPLEWDLIIDRRGDTPFPTGTHQLALEITVVDERCAIPLTLVVG